MARGVRHAVALAAGEHARLFMQAIAVTVAGGTNKGRLADPRQWRVPDDRDALLLLAIIQQNSGPLCRELVGFFTPLELCHDAIGKRACTQQGEHVEARAARCSRGYRFESGPGNDIGPDATTPMDRHAEIAFPPKSFVHLPFERRGQCAGAKRFAGAGGSSI